MYLKLLNLFPLHSRAPMGLIKRVKSCYFVWIAQWQSFVEQVITFICAITLVANKKSNKNKRKKLYFHAIRFLLRILLRLIFLSYTLLVVNSNREVVNESILFY